MWMCKSLVVIVFLSGEWNTIKALLPNQLLKDSEELVDLQLRDVSDRQRKIPALFAEPQSDYRITRVSKKDMRYHHQLTFDYVPANIRPRVKFLHEPSADIVYGGDGTTGEQGQVIVSISKASMYIQVLVFFTFPLGVEFSLSVKLDNDTLEEMAVPRLLTSVRPHHGDLVFEPGTQPRLELTMWSEEVAGVTATNRVDYEMVVRYGEDGMAEFDSFPWDNQVALQVVEVEETARYRHLVYAINTSSSAFPDPEGLLYLYPVVRLHCPSSSCLVVALGKNLPAITFRRADHGPPYPDNFLGFVYPSTTFRSFPRYCRVGQTNCSLYCLARWLDKYEHMYSVFVRISKVTPRGDVQATDDETREFAFHGSSFLHLPNVTQADSGGVYRCTVRSGSREISKDVELVVVPP